MMLRSIVLRTTLGTLALTGPVLGQRAASKNLLPNPSFEELEGDRPAHWHTNRWSGAPIFEVERGFGHTGDACLKISSTEGADASWSFEVKVRPRTDYRLSCWIKTEALEAATGFGAQLNLHQLQMTGKTEALKDTTDWTRVESEFHSGDHSALLVNMLYGGWGRSTGAAWFDDIELVDVTTPLPTLSEDEAARFFEQDVRPILEERCFSCHGEGRRPKARLYLNSLEGLLRGGESGPAIDLASPLDSLLLSAVNYEKIEMPPDGKLPTAQIETLTKWIRLGAAWSGESATLPAEAHDAEEAGGPEINEETRNHWSFRPVQRPSVPTPEDATWSEHPIDAFVAAGLDRSGLRPAPSVSRQGLIRRLSYGLLGLPPTPEEVEAFAQDDSEDAVARLVDRLLASPHYGEKWARHWLDLVRYAETNSFERDGPKPFVWRYRDWVIEALNQDMPYDRFLLEQLAGDELDEVTADSITATGFYRLGQWDDEPADPQQALYDELDDVLTTTSQSMLALRINCARCHDHKLDPIPQRDYYRMLSYFRNVRRYGIRAHNTVLDMSTREIASDEERLSQQQEVAQHQTEQAAALARVAAIEEIAKADFSPVEHQEFLAHDARPALLKKRVGGVLDEAVFAEYEELRKKLEQLNQFKPTALARALCVTESGNTSPPTHLLVRGNPHVPGEAVQPGLPEVLGVPDPEILAPPDGRSSGRRLALARWITAPDNPLTARVMMNRVWQFHFGRGLVRTPNDFGLTGSRPTHPELLDWLASEFVASGWSLKAMHRLILNTRTYQMSVADDAMARAEDPANDRLWRFDMRRLSAEELRDSILAVNRTLNPELHGPSIYTVIPKEVLAGQSRPGSGWGQSTPEQQARRSIYIHVKRSLIDPMLATHDFADTDFTCPVRFTTTQPTQALTMMNSDFLQEQAQHFAESLRRDAPGDPAAQVRLALRRTTQREPASHEVQRGLDLLSDLGREHGLDESRALASFCLVALNLNEFISLN